MTLTDLLLLLCCSLSTVSLYHVFSFLFTFSSAFLSHDLHFCANISTKTNKHLLSYSTTSLNPILSFLPLSPLSLASSYSSLIRQFHQPATRYTLLDPALPMVVTAGDSQSRCYTNSTHHWGWCWCWYSVGVCVIQIPHEAREPSPQHPSQYHHQPGTSQSIGPYQRSGHQNPFTPPPTNTPRGSNGAMGETARFISSHEQMSHGHI